MDSIEINPEEQTERKKNEQSRNFSNIGGVSLTRGSISMSQTLIDKAFGHGCTEKTQAFCADNQSCIMFWVLMSFIAFLLNINIDAVWVNKDDDYSAKPLDYSLIDEFIENQ